MKKSSSQMKVQTTFKVCLLGGSCGKTALLECLKSGKHDSSALASPTIEEDHTLKLKIDEQEVAFSVKDTSGNSSYDELRPSWFSWGEAFIILFNVTIRESYEEAAYFYGALKQQRNKEKKDANCVIVATAVDLDTDREMKIDAEKINKQFDGCPFIEVSSVSGYNVNAVMKAAMEAAIESRNGRDQKMKEEKRKAEEAKKKKKEEEKKKLEEEKKKKKDAANATKKELGPIPVKKPPPLTREIVSVVSLSPTIKEGFLECLVGRKWRKRYYDLKQGGQFVEYEGKGGKQMSFYKLSKEMSLEEYSEKGNENQEIKSFRVLIPPDTDMILKAETAPDMHSWLNEMKKASITPQELAQIKSEQEFNALIKNSRMPIKNISVKYLSVDDVGFRAEQNNLKYMEDDGVIFDCYGGDENFGYFAVFDGHGGRQTVDFVKEHLHNYIAQGFQTSNLTDSLRNGFLECDKNLCLQLKSLKSQAGATGAVMLIGWEGNDRMLYTANVGDSRIVISHGGVAERLTIDHNTKSDDEVQRIKKNKGIVMGDKVGGSLKVTRAFGDPELKKWVVADPYIKSTKLNSNDNYVILATDGVWDVVSDQEACDLIKNQNDTTAMANLLVDTALQRGTKDNATCLVIALPHLKNKRQEKWQDLISKLEKHLQSGMFDKEWMALEEQEVNRPQSQYSDALSEWNINKNRYTDILPLNLTRVRLSPIPGINGSDYINASRVENIGTSSYIACSAPFPHCFVEFYKMLWECKCQSIVMLTRCEESGTVKAHDYIPTSATIFGDITAEIVSREPYEYFVVTQLKLTSSRGESRFCTHYHYLAWPDHGVPNPEPMLYMMSQVFSQTTATHDGPQVVHCSAGVGRTGTWILIRALLEMLEQPIPYVSLMEILKDIRSQRAKCLTSMQQYVFLYNTLITILYSKLYVNSS